MTTLQDKFFRFIWELTKIFALVFALRSAMLLGGVPVVYVPFVDDCLQSFWHLLGLAFSSFSQSSFLPRFTSVSGR